MSDKRKEWEDTFRTWLKDNTKTGRCKPFTAFLGGIELGCKMEKELQARREATSTRKDSNE